MHLLRTLFLANLVREGAATAERLADDGYTVVLTYSSDSSAADATVSKVEAKHGKGSVFVSTPVIHAITKH